jgi:hypothetical protein
MEEVALQKLVHHTLYSHADVNSHIPDVDQMAAHLHTKLKITKTDLGHFTGLFMACLANDKLLKSCFYDDVWAELKLLTVAVQAAKKELLICAWTQGNLFLQTQKAQLFQETLDQSLLASPAIYASLAKMSILPNIFSDLAGQGCDLVCLVDDRLQNVLGAHKKIGNGLAPLRKLFIHKIRPDKKITHRLQSSDPSLQEVVEWKELVDILCLVKAKKLGLVLDKDGIIYNTTLYRKKLEVALLEFLKAFI